MNVSSAQGTLRLAGQVPPTVGGHALAQALADLAYRRFFVLGTGMPEGTLRHGAAGMARPGVSARSGVPQTRKGNNETRKAGRVHALPAELVSTEMPNGHVPQVGSSGMPEGRKIGAEAGVNRGIHGTNVGRGTHESPGADIPSLSGTELTQATSGVAGAHNPGKRGSTPLPATVTPSGSGDMYPDRKEEIGQTALVRGFLAGGSRERPATVLFLAAPGTGAAKENGRGSSGLVQIQPAPRGSESAEHAVTTAPAVQRSTAALAGKELHLLTDGRAVTRTAADGELPETGRKLSDGPAVTHTAGANPAPSPSSRPQDPAVCKTPGGAPSSSSSLTFPAAGGLSTTNTQEVMHA